MRNRLADTKNLRLGFLPGQQQGFIDLVYKKSGLSTKELALLAGVHTRSFSDWRKGNLTMTVKAAKVYCDKFQLELPESIDTLVARWKLHQSNANAVGGVAAFKKYGLIATDEGRRKGGRNSLALLRSRGIIPLCKTYHYPHAFSSNLAEFVGILLGDGGITNTQCFVTLNGEVDRDYGIFLSEFWAKLFGEKPKLYKHKNDKAITYYYNGVSFVEYLISIGLLKGNKVKQQVSVPSWILSSLHYRIACLRGLIDTDGGVFIHRYRVNNKRYMYRKLCFTNRSLPLLTFVNDTMISLGFSAKLIDNVENKKVWLYNSAEIERYYRIVGSNNSRLLKYR